MFVEQLRAVLANIPAGPIADHGRTLELLEACWSEFAGSEEHAMAPHKLRRMERVLWSAPFLSFVIERHGGTVMGSSRADLQRWTVDIETLVAECEIVGHRQVEQMQARLDVRPLAKDVARLIVSRAADPRLKWCDDGSVRVLIGKMIPAGSAVRQTLEGRRRRFRDALTGLLEDKGWRVVRPNVYGPAISTGVSNPLAANQE